MRTSVFLSVLVTALFTLMVPARAVLNGKPVTAEEQNIRGLVFVGGGCSGTMLSEDWVVSAGHCVPQQRPNPLVNVRAAWDGTAIDSDAIYQFADFSAKAANPGPEIALIHLSRPMPGIRPGYRLQLYQGTSGSLIGQTISKYGQGFSTLADANPATVTSVSPGGLGTFRAADLVVSSAPGYQLVYPKNAENQIVQPGDSGGPGFIWSSGTAYLAGVTSSAQWNCFMGSSDAQCRLTTFAVNTAYDIAIPFIKPAMEAVLRTTWNPRLTSQNIRVFRPEVTVFDGGITDINNIAWARAMRAGNRMCYNRGFSGGRFDGHQLTGEGSFGLHCAGVGAAFRDASAAEIAATGWGFSDINTVAWPVAARAAERLCATANQGYVGGHFNGQTGVGGAVSGLICLRDNARWFDATQAEIMGTAWSFPIEAMENVPWQQASRAATDICRAKGFLGGFFNGQHVPGRAGMVCQK